MNSNPFSYTYSAGDTQQILAIRKKYLPAEETKLEQLRRLNRCVQNAGIIQALTAGILGSLIFGVGFCFAMKVLGNALWLGIVLMLLGTVVMLAAHPIHKKLFSRAKNQHAPRILELTAELTGIA